MSAAAAVAGQPSSDREGGWGSSILPAEEVEATTEAAAAAGTPVGAEATNANTMQRTAEMHEAAGVAYTSRLQPVRHQVWGSKMSASLQLSARHGKD